MPDHDFYAPGGFGENMEPDPRQELGPDELAMDAHNMTDPMDQGVDRILREAKETLSQDLPGHETQEPVPYDGEFRDQEYRDAFDEGFEQAFQEPSESDGSEQEPALRSSGKRRRPRRKPIKKKGSGLFGIPHFITTLVLAAMVLAAGITFARILWLWADDVLALTKKEREATVVIYDTDTMEDISRKLADAGLIRYPKLFNKYCDLTAAREKISAGQFILNEMYDYHALIDGMSGYSNREEVEVMIPEGYECRQIFELLEKNGVCTVEALETAAQEGDLEGYWFLKDVSRDGPYCLEGFLFPDTYEFYVTDNPERVLRKMLNNFEYRFNEDMEADITGLNMWLAEKLADNGYDESYIESQYLDVRDVVNIAAMIERETAGSGESTIIASVIYNRLCSPDYPYLNIDATIQYALGERKANLTYEDLEIDSPYNTYRNPGLPIGPIANPGMNSLKAALHPEETDYFWYALDPNTGTHHFSQTQQEHQAFLDGLEDDDGN